MGPWGWTEAVITIVMPVMVLALTKETRTRLRGALALPVWTTSQWSSEIVSMLVGGVLAAQLVGEGKVVRMLLMRRRLPVMRVMTRRALSARQLELHMRGALDLLRGSSAKIVS